MSEKKQCQCYTAVQIGTCDEDCDRMTAKKQTDCLAKQKAEEIYQKMYKVRSNSASDISKHFAKLSALIAVDEAIKAIDHVCTNEKTWSINHDYWQQVRSEIEKL